MEETQRSSDGKTLRTPKKEVDERGLRHTRSHAAPDWSKIDSLILVNEIAAVETECKESLSSYQKWKIIADNCTALDVVRNSNQCHRHWDSLLTDYNMIKKWETQLGSDSLWSLGSERKKELEIPEDFDSELFAAIDNLVRAQEARLDTDPDTDPEADADEDADADADAEAEPETIQVFSEYESKKQRRRLMPQVCNTVQEEAKTKVEEKEEKPVHKKKESMLATKLREKAELIHAILKGKLTDEKDCKLSELRNDEAARVDFIRLQGDKLIACFGDLVNTLHQVCDPEQK